jgi:hypothetical protein
VRRKRRPRRNTLKEIGRLLGVADTAHTDRKDKLQAQAATLSDTRGIAIREDLDVVDVTYLLAGVDVDKTVIAFPCRITSACHPREARYYQFFLG